MRARTRLQPLLGDPPPELWALACLLSRFSCSRQVASSSVPAPVFSMQILLSQDINSWHRELAFAYFAHLGQLHAKYFLPKNVI